MTDSLHLLDMFVRGIAVGATAVWGFSFLASGVGQTTRLLTSLLSLSVICWLIAESRVLWSVFGLAYPLIIPSYPLAGLFWLFVLTAFEDRRVTAALWFPAGLLLISGLLCDLSPQPLRDGIWAARNLFSIALVLHAAVVVARGWSGDLLEVRRQLRLLVLGSAALFGIINTAIFLIDRIYPHRSWLQWTSGSLYGGAIFAALMVAAAVVFLQGRPAAFAVTRRAAQGADARAEAAERLMLKRLDELMAADGWRREGLTIGAIARELGEPEHRLRRLINQRLGHRNFTDFVNSFRVEAAKQRLADPAEARTTVAAIAFDLGYGSLGPFNRAFRAATGASPTEWRRQALANSPELQEAL